MQSDWLYGFSLLHFWRENDIKNCVPKFGFANMGYLMLPFERTFHKDLKTEKKNLKYLYPLSTNFHCKEKTKLTFGALAQPEQRWELIPPLT